MSKIANQQPSGINTDDVVRVGGPIAGSSLGLIGAIIILIGFILPWVTCGLLSRSYSGIDIVVDGLSGNLDDSRGTFLILIPLLALFVLLVSLANIPATLMRNIPYTFIVATNILILVVSTIICIPLGLFYTNTQSEIKNTYGFVKIDYGFWVSALGVLLSIFGGLMSVVTSGMYYILAKFRNR